MINFGEMIDNHLEREKNEKEVGKYYPSNAGMCMRKTWFSYKQPRKKDSDLLKIFEVGNMLHSFVAEVLESDENPKLELLENERSFRERIDDFQILGRIDNVILTEDGERAVVEVKSIKDIKYAKEPSNHHELQLQIYMHFAEIENGILVYVDKTNLKTKVFELPYEKEKAFKALGRIRKLHKKLEEDKLPSAEGRNSEEKGWMCKYCEYKDLCERKD